MIITRTQPRDTWNLANDLRPEDLQEIALGSGRDPHDVLMDGWHRSDICETVWARAGIPAAIWGVTPTPESKLGSIWMLASPEIESVSLPFLRACQPRIDRAHALYPVLACASWRGNDLHHRWLRWLRFKEAERHGEFIVFVRHV
jgi:hypothetical protein